MEIYTQVNKITELGRQKLTIMHRIVYWSIAMGKAMLLSLSVRNELQACSKSLLLMNMMLFDSTEQQLCEQSFLGRK